MEQVIHYHGCLVLPGQIVVREKLHLRHQICAGGKSENATDTQLFATHEHASSEKSTHTVCQLAVSLR